MMSPWSLVTLIGIVLGGFVPAAAAEPERAQARHGPEYVELGNGLRVLLGNSSPSLLFSEVLLVVRAGTGTAPSGQEELSRVAAEALLAGRRSAEAPPVGLELARLGVLTDFTVGREVAVFRFALPSREALHFLQLLAQLLGREPDAQTWADAAARRAQAISRDNADPWQRASSQLTSLIWNEDVAPAKDVAVATPVLADFWRRHYVPKHMVLSVWGVPSISQLTKSVEDDFSRLPPAQSAPQQLAIAEPRQNHERATQCLHDARANPAALLVGAGTSLASDTDFYGWQLFAHILGASSNSRLQNRLRTESQLVYTVEAAALPVGEHGIILRVVVQTDQLARTRDIIAEELRRLAREPVSSKEIEYARALLRSRLRLDTISERDQFYRRSLAMLTDQPARDPAEAERLIAAFTPERLRDLLERTLNPDELFSVVISRHTEAICETSP